MSTPTIEIEASEKLEEQLDLAVGYIWANIGQSRCSELRALLAEVTRARCLAKRYDEQQIHLPLPRVTACTCTVTKFERMENPSCPEHFPTR